MTTEELKQIISKRGAVAKTIFYTIFDIYKEWYDDNNLPDGLNEEYLAVISYNATILLMEKIRDNQDFFEKNYHVNERNRNRMLKDMKVMTLLDYPDGSTEHNYEKEYVNSLGYRYNLK